LKGIELVGTREGVIVLGEARRRERSRHERRRHLFDPLTTAQLRLLTDYCYSSQRSSTACLLLLAYYCVLTTACLLLRAYYCLLTTACLLLRAYYCLLTTACLLLLAYYCLLTTACLLLRAYYCLLTTACLLLRADDVLAPTSCLLFRLLLTTSLLLPRASCPDFRPRARSLPP
jgi:hypothetical protein